MNCTRSWCKNTEFVQVTKPEGYSINMPWATWYRCTACGAEQVDRLEEVRNGRATPRLRDFLHDTIEARARSDDSSFGGTRAGGKGS